MLSRCFIVERTKSIPIVPQITADGVILVDWYETDDADNPQNWSFFKKSAVVFILCIYTSIVYCAGPIYAASEGSGILEEYRISAVPASLGLSLYVLAYGVGDLIFSPLTEIPVVGRNHVYYLTFIVFWILSFGPPVVGNFGGFLVTTLLAWVLRQPSFGQRGCHHGRHAGLDTPSVWVVLLGV